MRSVSGVRGIVGADLTPDVVRRYAAAFGRAYPDVSLLPIPTPDVVALRQASLRRS